MCYHDPRLGVHLTADDKTLEISAGELCSELARIRPSADPAPEGLGNAVFYRPAEQPAESASAITGNFAGDNVISQGGIQNRSCTTGVRWDDSQPAPPPRGYAKSGDVLSEEPCAASASVTNYPREMLNELVLAIAGRAAHADNGSASQDDLRPISDERKWLYVGFAPDLWTHGTASATNQRTKQLSFVKWRLTHFRDDSSFAQNCNYVANARDIAEPMRNKHYCSTARSALPYISEYYF